MELEYSDYTTLVEWRNTQGLMFEIFFWWRIKNIHQEMCDATEMEEKELLRK